MNKLGVRILTFAFVLLFIFPSLSLTVQSIPPITQDTIIVDITGNGDFTSIKEAIGYADVTDIIEIRKGIYNEHSIVIREKIEIIGEDPNNTIINCSKNIAFTLKSSFVDIRNIQIINTEEFAIVVEPDNKGCTISNVIIDTNYRGIAIDLRSSYNKIINCKLYGLGTSKQGVKINGLYNLVENCDIQNFGNGIQASVGSNYNEIKNCNIINNENAIDFRVRSNHNIITGCNIFSNLQSVKIWQNSNYNQVYLNNFWKNDVDAIDESNNSWDNSKDGNYWDKYQGKDNNGDGIGDTPYTISVGNIDRFPRVSMILPDVIIHPTNVRQTSSKSDTTPSFSWNPSVYNKGIKGYHVKIDTYQVTFIGDVTSWTSYTPLSDGVHTFYIKGEGSDGTFSNYSIISFSIDTTIIDSDNDGWSDTEEEQYGTDSNNSDHYPLDTDFDHIPDSVDSDDDNDGYSDEMELSYQTSTTDSINYPTDTDHDGTPNEDSNDGIFIGDYDDDDDGLPDETENSIGSNSLDSSDAFRIYINGKPYHLVAVSDSESFNILYEFSSGISSGVSKYGDDYLIDIDGDGSYDHIYGTLDGSVSTYSEPIIIPTAVWLLIVLIILFVALYFIPRYLKGRIIKYRLTRKPKKTIKTPVIEKTLKLPLGEKKDTIMMIGQTKALLQNIHQDVEVYMQKLRELEQQFTTLPTKEIEKTEESKDEEPQIIRIPKEEPIVGETPEKEIPGETKDISEIEAKVDKILSELDDEDKN
jgi:hypothetical protein